jgi:hypothetical protein
MCDDLYILNADDRMAILVWVRLVVVKTMKKKMNIPGTLN